MKTTRAVFVFLAGAARPLSGEPRPAFCDEGVTIGSSFKSWYVDRIHGPVAWSAVPPVPGHHKIVAHLPTVAGPTETAYLRRAAIIPRIAPMPNATPIAG